MMKNEALKCSDARRPAASQIGEEGYPQERRNLSPLFLRRFEPELFGDPHFVKDLLSCLAEGGAAGKLRNDLYVAFVF